MKGYVSKLTGAYGDGTGNHIEAFVPRIGYENMLDTYIPETKEAVLYKIEKGSFVDENGEPGIWLDGNVYYVIALSNTRCTIGASAARQYKLETDGVYCRDYIAVTLSTFEWSEWERIDNIGELRDIVAILPGKKTKDGGEVFCDYEGNNVISPFAAAFGANNLSGARAFTITAIDHENKTYTLDSVEGLSVGDVYSIHLYNQWENAGKITAINTATNTVTVDVHYGAALNTTSVVIEDNGFDNEKNTFRVIAKPKVGTRKIGCGSVNLGYFGKTLSKGALTSGFKNTSYGSYSVTLGAENKAGYCGFAQGAYNEVSGFWSAVFGKRNIVSGEASFGAGEGLQITGDKQSVFGTYNKPVPEALQIVGNGTADSARSNACVLYKNGNAEFSGNVYAGGKKLLSSENMPEALAEYIGSYAVTPYISGVSGAFSVELDFPIQHDSVRIWTDGTDISGSVAKGEAFVTAPVIFDSDDVSVTFEREGTVVLTAKLVKVREVGGVVLGKLRVEG